MTGMANVPLSRCTIRAQPAGRTETTGRAVSPRAYTCPEEFIAKHSGVRASEVIGKVDTVKGLGDSNRRSQVHTIPNALPE
ncbi:MAG: hypothetical protein KVP17_003459 [Porospora cf. gigantea B]|uniref:uncharacterized protein n=1 Tax=Porospora cf. gigantea B TaxID=2853592 RepID=UPI003571E0A7|nr:MAG: hypothetical protein KVP17_003459 [Porospora cf. gigantea B]